MTVSFLFHPLKLLFLALETKVSTGETKMKPIVNCLQALPEEKYSGRFYSFIHLFPGICFFGRHIAFCLYQNHTVTATLAIQFHRSCIFQYGDRFYLVGI